MKSQFKANALLRVIAQVYIDFDLICTLLFFSSVFPKGTQPGS